MVQERDKNVDGILSIRSFGWHCVEMKLRDNLKLFPPLKNVEITYDLYNIYLDNF